MPFNLIVLDFDGTLFPTRFFLLDGGGADPVLVYIVNRLCAKHGFKIVVSSIMQEQGRESCAKALEEAGISSTYLAPGDLWRTIPEKTNKEAPKVFGRQEQLIAWYNMNKEVIDDLLIFEDDCGPPLALIEYWYSCDSETGLSRNLILHLMSAYNLMDIA